MENINIKVAFCQNCGGYHSATPADYNQIDHPEIIDHFFYHGEPWFTLDPEIFKKAEMLENTVTKILPLHHHQIYDYMYCTCVKEIKKDKCRVYTFTVPNYTPAVKKTDKEIDAYFRDVYSLCYNFH